MLQAARSRLGEWMSLEHEPDRGLAQALARPSEAEVLQLPLQPRVVCFGLSLWL